MGDTNGPFDPNYEIVRNLAVSHEELGDTALIHRRLESLQVRPLSQDSEVLLLALSCRGFAAAKGQEQTETYVFSYRAAERLSDALNRALEKHLSGGAK